MNFGQVGFRPSVESEEGVRELPAERGQRIVDAGRHDGIHRAANQAIPLQVSECLRQHLLGDAVNPPMEFAMAFRALGQLVKDQQRTQPTELYDVKCGV